MSLDPVGVWINIGSTLATTVVEAWKTLKDVEQRQLDREHQLRLQRAQHSHDILLAHLKGETIATPHALQVQIGQELLWHLNQEAGLLNSMGFNVIFESIGDGYGLALVVDEDTTLAFWIPPAFPHDPPNVLLLADNMLDELTFARGAWTSDSLIADVVLAVINAEESTVEREGDQNGI